MDMARFENGDVYTSISHWGNNLSRNHVNYEKCNKIIKYISVASTARRKIVDLGGGSALIWPRDWVKQKEWGPHIWMERTGSHRPKNCRNYKINAGCDPEQLSIGVYECKSAHGLELYSYLKTTLIKGWLFILTVEYNLRTKPKILNPQTKATRTMLLITNSNALETKTFSKIAGLRICEKDLPFALINRNSHYTRYNIRCSKDTSKML